MEKFYYLTNGWATKYYWLDILENVSSKMPRWGELIKQKRLTFTISKGSAPADILGTTLAEDVYSERFVKFLQAHNFKTFKFYKIKINETLNYFPNYYYLEPVSKLKRINKSELFNHNCLLDLNNNCYGDLNTWDSSDIFSIENTRFIIITEKVKVILEKQRFKNLKIKEVNIKC